MLVQNNSTAPVNLYLRDGQRYHIGVGRQITLPDSYTALLDDNASTIALFNSGVLTALTDAGAPFPNFPTAVNAADAKAGRTETLSGIYDKNGTLTLSGASAAAVRGAEVRKRQTISGMLPVLPQAVAAAFTGTYSTLDTAPGEFEAVAPLLLNMDTNAVTIDKMAIAVTERTDTSKTVPIINGVSYNVLAAAGTQNGFVPVTFSGSASVSVPASSDSGNMLGLMLADFIPLSSIPRVDDPSKFPAHITRMEVSNRALSTIAFPTLAEVDNYNAALAPYEHYQVAQASVTGVTDP